MIYLYTFYADIPPHIEAADSLEFRQKRERSAARDAIFRDWLLRTGIGPFPKTEAEAERCAPLFADYSRHDPMVYIVFQRADSCSVLNNGTWATYADMATATREIFSIPPDGAVQYHRNVVFKDEDEAE